MNVTLTNLNYEEMNQIGYLYLAAPHGNKMSKDFLDDLCNVFENVIFCSDIKGLLIMGQGKHFSSGADVDQLISNVITKSMIEKDEIIAYPSWFLHIKEIFNAIAEMNIPVVTGISGFCIGSGLELALAGNIRLCSEGSVIGFPESTFGLLPGATGTLRSMELIGMSNAMDLVLEGQFIDAEKAVNLGLLHKICPKKELKESCERALQQALVC